MDIKIIPLSLYDRKRLADLRRMMKTGVILNPKLANEAQVLILREFLFNEEKENKKNSPKK